MVTIRPMQAFDIADLLTWMPAVPLWQRYQISAESLKTQLESALSLNDLLFVAQEAEELQGFLWCQPKAVFGRSAYIKLLGVKEGHQGKGIGKLLLEALEPQVQALSKDLFLLVSDFNEAAQRFYLRHGFRKIGSISSYVLADVDEFIFRKTFN